MFYIVPIFKLCSRVLILIQVLAFYIKTQKSVNPKNVNPKYKTREKEKLGPWAYALLFDN